MDGRNRVLVQVKVVQQKLRQACGALRAALRTAAVTRGVHRDEVLDCVQSARLDRGEQRVELGDDVRPDVTSIVDDEIEGGAQFDHVLQRLRIRLVSLERDQPTGVREPFLIQIEPIDRG